MIKPNTLCMIRNCTSLPEANGMIVVTGTVKRHHDGVPVWFIQPPVTTRGRHYTGCHQQWLYPLDNPSDDLVDSISQMKETA